jgi:putative ABC transport system permease protein
LLALLGLSLGLAGAYGVGRVMQSTLFDMGVIDYPVLCGAAIVLLMAALLASLLPARRAAIVEPMRVLNAE